jgi:transposase-like protein
VLIWLAMTIVSTEIVDRGEKNDARGRKLLDGKERAAMIAAYEQSGLTQRAFAQREGIKYSTFVAWLLRYRQQAAGPAKPKFAEVRLPTMRPNWTMEIALPNGIVIRGQDASNVTALVNALRSC